MIVGRRGETAAITGALDAARAGRGRVLGFEGDAGIGKSTLLEWAVESAPDLLTLRVLGVEHELHAGHAGLADALRPVRAFLDAVPSPARAALEAACGWAGSTAAGQPYQVAAGTLSLLAAAAAERPVLLVVDDLQWVDRESAAALTFAARRLAHDAVATVMAFRSVPAVFAGFPVHRLDGLDTPDARALLRGTVAAGVADRLTAQTSGNPLALIEVTRALTAAQQNGSAPLPDVLPVGERLSSAFGRTLENLSPAAHRALLLTAACTRASAGDVVAALRKEGLEADSVLAEAEQSEAVVLESGELRFRHPLLRSAVWHAAPRAEQRSAHRTLAGVVPDDGRQVLHAGRAAVGFDDALALRLLDLAAVERRRAGHAAAGVLAERAAQLTSSPAGAAACRAAAVEDAFLSGDVPRVRTLAARILDAPADDATRARALLWLGTAEQYAGSVHRARELLQDAATRGRGDVRLRAVAELAQVGYRLNLRSAVTSAADVMDRLADVADPGQEMLTCYVRGAALAFGGEWAAARAPMERALQLLEGEESLRDDPRYLVMALLAPGWLGDLTRVLPYLERRMDAARAAGAIGVLPMALTLIAGGAAQVGRHQLAYACAGEVVELGLELGYVADVGTAYELLAWQEAARGRPTEAAGALAEARRMAGIAGVSEVSVHVDLVDAFAALCRGEPSRTIAVLERRLEIDGGRLPRGEHELGVAPDLVEAYLAVGRAEDAAALARRHDALHRDSPDPDVRALAARLGAVTGLDDTAFEAAHRAHAQGSNAFEAARTRLLHGSRLRRDGRRVAAREQLGAAAAAFRAMGLDGWADRADAELAGSGRTARRGARPGQQLTSQELRVVLLIVRGLTNREIAASLFLSVKTVEHHVTSALRKRGMRSRTELAVAFTEHPSGAR